MPLPFPILVHAQLAVQVHQRVGGQGHELQRPRGRGGRRIAIHQAQHPGLEAQELPIGAGGELPGHGVGGFVAAVQKQQVVRVGLQARQNLRLPAQGGGQGLAVFERVGLQLVNRRQAGQRGANRRWETLRLGGQNAVFNLQLDGDGHGLFPCARWTNLAGDGA